METEENKKRAIDFQTLLVAGKIDEAYEKHVDMNGKHHNGYFPSGFLALKEAMKDNELEFPDKKLFIKNVLGDGDLVAVHSHIVLRSDDPGIAAVHLYRFSGGKIVEMWDIGQPIPRDIPNQDGLF